MSDERHISRRTSLRGIVATGALIGGTGLGTGAAIASKKNDVVKKIKFKDCHSVAVHLKDGVDEVPVTIRVYNAEADRIDNFQLTISRNDLVPYKLWKGIYEDKKKEKMEHDPDKNGDHDYNKKKEKCLCKDHDKKHNKKKKRVWLFSIYQYYDHAIDAGDKILSVKIGDERIKNTNECAKKYPNEYGQKGEVDTDDIYLQPVCFNEKNGTFRFRVYNSNETAVTVHYEVDDPNQSGELKIEPLSATYFDVDVNDQSTVTVFYNGNQIDEFNNPGTAMVEECLPDITFDVSDVDYSKRKVKFLLTADTEGFDRTFNYYDHKTDAAGTITVEDGPASAETFWLPAPRCKTSLKLFYQGHVVGKASNSEDLSGPVVNKTQRTSYETIQDAVDDANEGDTIIVCEDQELDETVEVDVENLTIKGFEKPVVDGSGNSPVFDIVADRVTIKKLKITNPDELLGIRIGEDVDGVTIRDNRLFDIGPTGSLGVTGILVGFGDHDAITIENNTIENLEQTDDGSFATINGILFDTDGFDEPGTLTNVTVRRNTIRNFESTTASLGIVVQHNVDDLLIEHNKISDLTADNDFGPGSFRTFAQGISIDSRSTNEFDIVGNTIKNIESNNGFFGEDIKIEPEADVSGIAINENNLLSAIGVNNADGDNPDVDAENNFWGDEDGPIVIESNDDDGTVTTADGDEVNLDNFDASAVTQNVDFEPFATSRFPTRKK